MALKNKAWRKQPLCACGCGQRKSHINRKYFPGHPEVIRHVSHFKIYLPPQPFDSGLLPNGMRRYPGRQTANRNAKVTVYPGRNRQFLAKEFGL